MNTGINYAELFYSQSSNDITVLEKNVKDNPASAVARFLLLYHYKKNDDPAFEKFAKQSSLYFNNPYWLQLQLSQAGLKKEASNLSNAPASGEAVHVAVTLPGDEDELKGENILLESDDQAEVINNNLPAEVNKEEIIPFESKDENTERLLPADNAEPLTQEENVAFEPEEESLESNYPVEIINNNLPAEVNKEETIAIESKDENTERLQPVDNTEPPTLSKEEVVLEPEEENLQSNYQAEVIDNDLPAEIINNLPAEVNKEETIAIYSKDENTERLQPVDNTEPPTLSKEEVVLEPEEENLQSNVPVEIIDNDLPAEVNEEEIIPFESKDENTERLLPDDNMEPPSKEENVAFEPKEEMLETDQLNNKAPFENIKEEPLAFEPKEEIPETPQPVELINDLPPAKNKEQIIPFEQTPDIESSASNNTEEELPAFEPLYTIDYFASQGIKIREEALMNDKLGKQMKSFTAWLKSMKKLHPGKLPEQNEVIEKIIQSSAEESNADTEVLTEAMAEVLIKQNKVEKAIGMYQKLSLLNPSKSAYFAAKIENLKTN